MTLVKHAVNNFFSKTLNNKFDFEPKSNKGTKINFDFNYLKKASYTLFN